MAVQSERPWHLPLIAALAILFYLALAGVYLLVMLRISAFTQLFSQNELLVFTALPDVMDGLWAIFVWGGLLGAVLLWMESRRTALVLGLAFLSLLAVLAYLLFVANAMAVMGPVGLAWMGGVVLVALIVYIYARQMHAAGYID